MTVHLAQPIHIAIGAPPKQKSAAVCVHLVMRTCIADLSKFLRLLSPAAARFSQIIDDEMGVRALQTYGTTDWRATMKASVVLDAQWQTNDWFPKGDVSWFLDSLGITYFMWVRNAKWDTPTYSLLMSCAGVPQLNNQIAEMTTENGSFAKLLSRPALHCVKSHNLGDTLRTLDLLCKSFITPYLRSGVSLKAALTGPDLRIALQSKVCSKFIYDIIDFVRQYWGAAADAALASASNSWVFRFNAEAGEALRPLKASQVGALEILNETAALQKSVSSVSKAGRAVTNKI